MNASCSGCETRWTGWRIAHCGACHATFTTQALFDRHRFRGRCLNPETTRNQRGLLLFSQTSRGFWRSASTREWPKEDQ